MNCVHHYFLLALLCLAQPRTADAATEMAIIGDAGYPSSSARMVRESIARNKVAQLILPGDNLYAGTYASVWAPWQAAGLSFAVVALGNHNGGYAQEMAFFSMPSEYYSTVIDGARFLVLNSDNESTGDQQAAWLARELINANEEIVFVVYHHPSYTVSSYHSWIEKKDFHLAVRPVLGRNRAKITALVVGHDHLASLLHFNDLPVLLSGAVQEVRRDRSVNELQDGVRVQTAWHFDNTAHWAKLSWNASAAHVDYIRAQDDYVTCTAFLANGRKAELQTNCRATPPRPTQR